MAEQTVDDLEERLLHTGKALFQQLGDKRVIFSERLSMQPQNVP